MERYHDTSLEANALLEGKKSDLEDAWKIIWLVLENGCVILSFNDHLQFFAKYSTAIHQFETKFHKNDL